MTTNQFTSLSDDELIARALQAAVDERGATVNLLRLLMEVDQRRLYLQRGYPSLFAFCTSALRLSEASAYGRITASRAARRSPGLLDALEIGDLTLSSIGRLAQHLSDENADSLLESARGRSTRDVERLVASLYPEPAIPTAVRAMPVRSETSQLQPTMPEPANPLLNALDANPVAVGRREAEPLRRNAIAPVGPSHFCLKVTIGDETHHKLNRLRSLMRHTIPDGDVAAIIDRALTLLLAKVETQKYGALKRPAKQVTVEGPSCADRSGERVSTSSRHIPATVRRSVWKRDGGRCAFVGADGRCSSCDFLEFHHVIPFATGGPATTDNIELRCRAHNAYEAALFFGDPAATATTEALPNAGSADS